MDNAKAINTPMSTSTKLDMDIDGECFDKKILQGYDRQFTVPHSN